MANVLEMESKSSGFSLPLDDAVDFDWYVRAFEEERPVSLSRWGDGEWRAVFLGDDQARAVKEKRAPRIPRTHRGGMQSPLANCDDHKFFPQMNKRLCKILKKKPTYLLGMQPLAMRLYGEPILQFCEANCPESRWHSAAVFAYAVAHGRFGQMLKAMQSYPVIMVGPNYTQRASAWFGKAGFHYVKVPQVNCYRSLEQIEEGVRKVVDKQTGKSVISIVASMPAGILVHRLHSSYGGSAFILDMGSTYDPLLGINSRNIHKTVDVAANLRGV